MTDIKKYLLWTFLLWTCVCTAGAQNNFDAMEHRLQSWPQRDRYESNKGAEHLFLSGAFGGNFSFMGNPFLKANLGATASGYIGKWFTPEHGFRAGIHANLLNHPDTRIKGFGLSADYLLNLSALSGGYNPRRLLEVYGVAGVGMNANFQFDREDRQFAPTGYVGLQGSFRLSPITRFFIEPGLQIGKDNYDRREHWRGYDAAFTLQAGFTYEILERSKRASTQSFEHTPFGNNLFLSYSVGINQLLTSRASSHVGPELGLALGKWFSPHSGLRLGVSGGLNFLNRFQDPLHRHKFVEGQADYLLNLNNLCGYYRENPFEVIALAGVRYAHASSYLTEGWNNAFGVGFGLQGNLWVSKNTSLFLEPRISLFHRNFASGVSLNSLDLFGELVAGFTMHTANRSERRSMDKMDNSDFWNHLFVQVGAGAEMLVTPKSLVRRNMIGPNFQLAVGKWWNPRSGLRLGVDAGWNHDRESEHGGNLYNGSLTADYLWNITNAFYGYDQKRKLYLIANAGAVLTATAGDGVSKVLHLGGEFGLQGLWQVNRRLGLYLQPEARLYGNEIHAGYSLKDKLSVLTNLRAGVIVNFGEYNRAGNHQQLEASGRNNFFSIQGGTGSITTRYVFDQPGVRLRASIGRWYTPLSGWRISAAVHRAKSQQGAATQYGGIELDYLFSLSTLYADYNPDRVFNLNAFLGADAGASYMLGGIGMVGGIHAGIQADFRLTKGLHLFLEPRMGIFSRNYGHNYTRPVPETEINIGLTHYLHDGTSKRKHGGSSFVAVGTGLGLYSGASGSTPLGQLLTKSADVVYGRWFNPKHGLQVGISDTHLNVLKDTPLNFITVKADYMLSLSNLMAGADPDRRFGLDGIVGILAAIPNGNDISRPAVGSEVAFRAKYRLYKGLGIYGQPVFRIYDNNLDRIHKTGARINAAAALEFGLTFDF